MTYATAHRERIDRIAAMVRDHRAKNPQVAAEITSRLARTAPAVSGPERIAAITGTPEAKANPTFAQHLAFRTSLSPEQALGALRAASKPAGSEVPGSAFGDPAEFDLASLPACAPGAMAANMKKVLGMADDGEPKPASAPSAGPALPDAPAGSMAANMKKLLGLKD